MKALLLLLFPALTWAATVDDVRFLTDKANSQAAHGRTDLAQDTWRQLLTIDPNNVTALGSLAVSMAHAGKAHEARDYLQRLRGLDPSSPWIAKVEQVSAAPKGALGKLMEEAGQAQSRGDNQTAVNLYDQAFSGNEPPPPMARAYFDALSRTRDGKAQAVRRLRALVEAHPDDAYYRLALGELLTYDAVTRNEGLELLRRLRTRKDDIGQQARMSWEKARNWGLPTTTRTNSATAAKNRPSTPSKLKLAYQALNAGRLEEADQAFSGLLASSPQENDYVQGLAEVRMAQRRFADALDLYGRLPQNDKIAGRMREARAYGAMEIAAAEAAVGHDEEAIHYYQRANEWLPDNPDILNGLSGSQMAAGRYQEALVTLRHALKLRPESSTLWRARLEALSHTRQYGELTELDKSMPIKVRGELQRDMQVQLLLAEAWQQRGDEATAMQALDNAFLQYPRANPNQRLQLAWLLRAAGDEARVATLLASLRNTPLNDDQLAQWQQLAELRAESLARQALRSGDIATARQEAERLNGDKLRSLTVDINLQDAWQRYKLRQDRELYRLLMDLYQTPNLSVDQRRQVRDLFKYGADREASVLLKQKQFDPARSVYENLQSLFPDDPYYTRQLALVDLGDGQPRRAFEIISPMGIGDTPEDAKAAIGAALGAGEQKTARQWVGQALSRWPDDLSLLHLAAQIDEASGDWRSALARYQETLRQSKSSRWQNSTSAVYPGMPVFSGKYMQ